MRTPTNLKDAIYDALKTGTILSEFEIAELVIKTEAHVKDFLAQRFGTSLLTVETEEETRAIIALARCLGFSIRNEYDEKK